MIPSFSKSALRYALKVDSTITFNYSDLQCNDCMYIVSPAVFGYIALICVPCPTLMLQTNICFMMGTNCRVDIRQIKENLCTVLCNLASQVYGSH